MVDTTFRLIYTDRDLVGGPRSRSGRTENLVSTGIRSSDRPARSDTPYRIYYPGRHFIKALSNISPTLKFINTMKNVTSLLKLLSL